MAKWECALELDSKRNIVRGSSEKLSAAIANAADQGYYPIRWFVR
jgi:hypothetical protein